MDNDINSMFDVQTSTTIANEQVKLEAPVEGSTPPESTTTATPETKPELSAEVKTETQATAEAKQPSLFDKFTKNEPVKPDGQTPVSETKPAVQPTSNNDFDLVKKELDEIKSHPAYQLLTGGKDLTGVDLKSFFKSAIGEDFNGLSDEQLLERSLKSNPAFSQLTDDEAKEEIEKAKTEMAGMSKLEKLTKRNHLVETLSKDVPQSEIMKKLAEIQDNQTKAVDPEVYAAEKYQEQFDTTFKDIDSYFEETGKSLIGQKYKGYEVTEEDMLAARSAFHKNANEFDKERVFFEYFLAVTADKREAAADKAGYERGRKEGANPSRNDTGSPVIVTNDNSSALKDATKEDFFAQANN